MASLVILGAREHGKIVWATLQDALPAHWQVLGFLDDNSSLHGTKLLGAPVLGPIRMLDELARDARIQGALLGISCNHMPTRKRLSEQIQRLGLESPSIVSPTAHVHSRAQVGPGCVICSGAVIHAFAQMGSHGVAYSNATVEHECVLEENVYLGPGVHFCAAVRVGAGSFIGTGANVVCERVGQDVVVGAGSTVIENIPDGAVVVGVPARVLRIRTPAERTQSFLLRDHSKLMP